MASRRSAPAAPGLPLYVVPDVSGPKVLLGLGWFGSVLAAAAASGWAIAGLMALASAAAADEVVRVHLGGRRWPVVLAGAAVPLGALAGGRGLLVAASGACVLVAVSRLLQPSLGGAVGEVAVGLAAVLPVGLAAASPVLVSRLGPAAAVTMVVLVSAYEVGDFVVGSGASTRWEGPMAGMVAVVVCGFAAWVLDVAPLHQDGVFAMAAVVAVLAPLGPPAGSVLLGAADRPGRYVRRIDSLLVAGPIAAWVASGLVHPV